MPPSALASYSLPVYFPFAHRREAREKQARAAKLREVEVAKEKDQERKALEREKRRIAKEKDEVRLTDEHLR